MKKPVIIYTTRKCSKCKSLKSWLRRNNISFVERDLGNIEVMTDLVMRNLVVLSVSALEVNERVFLSTKFLPHPIDQPQILIRF